MRASISVSSKYRIDFERLNNKTSLLNTQENRYQNFGLTRAEAKTLVVNMLSLYEKFMIELERGSIESIIEKLAEFSSNFFKILFEKKRNLDFIGGYRLIANGFMTFIHECYGIDENNFLKYLSDEALILQARISNYIIILYADYRHNPNLSYEESLFFAKLHLIEPFLVGLFPVPDKRLLELKAQEFDFNLSTIQKQSIHNCISQSVLSKTPCDRDLLIQVRKKLRAIHTRLESDYSNCWFKWLCESPKPKMAAITALINLLDDTKININIFDDELARELQSDAIRVHRLKIKQGLLCSLFKPPKIVGELRKLQDSLRLHATHPYGIAQTLRW